MSCGANFGTRGNEGGCFLLSRSAWCRGSRDVAACSSSSGPEEWLPGLAIYGELGRWISGVLGQTRWCVHGRPTTFISVGHRSNCERTRTSLTKRGCVYHESGRSMALTGLRTSPRVMTWQGWDNQGRRVRIQTHQTKEIVIGFAGLNKRKEKKIRRKLGSSTRRLGKWELMPMFGGPRRLRVSWQPSAICTDRRKTVEPLGRRR